MKFRDFKKVDVTSTHTVFKHPDGHLIHIANDKIPTSLRKEMRDIPSQTAMERLRESRKAKKMADGGNVEEEDSMVQFGEPEVEYQAPPSLASITPEQKQALLAEVESESKKDELLKQAKLEKAAAQEKRIKGTQQAAEYFRREYGVEFPELKSAAPQPAKPALENVPLSPPEGQPQVPSTPSMGSAMAIEGALQQIQGAQNVQESQKEKAEAETAALGRSLDQMQKSLTAAQQKRQKVYDNINRLSKAVEEGGIQPDRVLGSGSNKVMNVIGLVLGGAMQFATLGIVPNLVKQAIDDDIEKQKSELEQKNNLLGYNLKLLGNIDEAENVTRMQMASIADLQAKKAALKSADKEAMGRYQIFSGELQNKLIAPLMQQMEQQAAMQQASTQPITSPAQVSQLIEARVPRGSRRTAIEEYGKYKQVMNDIGQVRQIMQQQVELNTLAKRIGSPIQTSKLLASKKAQLFPIIKGIIGEKMTDADVKQMVDPFLVSLTTSPSTVNQLTDELISTIMSRAGSITPTLDIYEINLPKPIKAKPLPTSKRK